MPGGQVGAGIGWRGKWKQHAKRNALRNVKRRHGATGRFSLAAFWEWQAIVLRTHASGAAIDVLLAFRKGIASGEAAAGKQQSEKPERLNQSLHVKNSPPFEPWRHR